MQSFFNEMRNELLLVSSLLWKPVCWCWWILVMQCLSPNSAQPPHHQPDSSLLRPTHVDLYRKNVGNHEIWGNGLEKTCKDWTSLAHLELLDYKPASGFLYSFSDLRSSFILPAYIHIDNSQNVWILKTFNFPH